LALLPGRPDVLSYWGDQLGPKLLVNVSDASKLKLQEVHNCRVDLLNAKLGQIGLGTTSVRCSLWLLLLLLQLPGLWWVYPLLSRLLLPLLLVMLLLLLLWWVSPFCGWALALPATVCVSHRAWIQSNSFTLLLLEAVSRLRLSRRPVLKRVQWPAGQQAAAEALRSWLGLRGQQAQSRLRLMVSWLHETSCCANHIAHAVAACSQCVMPPNIFTIPYAAAVHDWLMIHHACSWLL